MNRIFSVLLILALLIACLPQIHAVESIVLYDGAKVAIYNEGSELCFGPPSYTSLEGVPSKNAIPGNGALIFEVSYDGSKYYTFKNAGEYIWK